MEKQVLYKNKKIEIRKSPIHGYGVFAKERINAGETLEECHYIKLTLNELLPELRRYTFGILKNNGITPVIVFGYGSIYNNSETKERGSVIVKSFKDYISFYAKKDINADEEIFIYYGKGWSNIG